MFSVNDKVYFIRRVGYDDDGKTLWKVEKGVVIDEILDTYQIQSLHTPKDYNVQSNKVFKTEQEAHSYLKYNGFKIIA